MFSISCSFLKDDESKKTSIWSVLEKSSPKWLTPYQAEIVQGNYISEDMVLRLRKGQTKNEVMTILGTPLLVDPFNPDRWDYVFDIKKNNGIKENRIFYVEFVDEELSRWEGNPVENSLEVMILPK
jgi:outer membrane protein assembly factor BamE